MTAYFNRGVDILSSLYAGESTVLGFQAAAGWPTFASTSGRDGWQERRRLTDVDGRADRRLGLLERRTSIKVVTGTREVVCSYT